MNKSVGLAMGMVLAGSVLVRPAGVKAEVLFRNGNILYARNVTAGQNDYRQSIEAKPNDELEFQVIVENIGSTESPDVNVRAGFALDPGLTLKNKIFVGVWSAPQASGTVEIKIDGDNGQNLVYESGKSVKFGGGCDGCGISDDIARANGAYVGKVKPGEKIEVRFRTIVSNDTNQVTSGNSSTPTPTPTIRPTTATNSAVAKTSPKTGFMDPIWVRSILWLMVGVAGYGIRKMARKLGTIEA